MLDSHFKITTLSTSPRPQAVVLAALRQDYSAEPVDTLPEISEAEAGELAVKLLLSGKRGHFGPLEHPQIVLNCAYFPHSAMQQLRTHRVGVSFDVQSFRYTSDSILAAARHEMPLEKVVYLRPSGEYSDRAGKSYTYNFNERSEDKKYAVLGCDRYRRKVEDLGYSEEHARGLIPFDVRQHFTVSMNARSLCHMLDLRWKADAQLECQQWAELAYEQFELWMPELARWYLDNRAKKALLAP